MLDKLMKSKSFYTYTLETYEIEKFLYLYSRKLQKKEGFAILLKQGKIVMMLLTNDLTWFFEWIREKNKLDISIRKKSHNCW